MATANITTLPDNMKYLGGVPVLIVVCTILDIRRQVQDDVG